MHIAVQQHILYASIHTVLHVFILKLLQKINFFFKKSIKMKKIISLHFKQDVTLLPLYATPGSSRLVCLSDCS